MSTPNVCWRTPSLTRRNRPAGPGRRLRVEPLEDRAVPSAALALDFNTASSPTAAGYTGVPLVQYPAAGGLGWESLTGLSAVSRSTTNALTRDFHTGVDGTFLADLPNGTYDVVIGLGDPSAARDRVSVWAEGQLLAANVSTAKGQFAEVRARVTVADGQLTVRVADGGGTSPKFAVYGLTATPVDPAAARLWPDGVTLTPVTSTSSKMTELGIRFQPDADGYITGVRFHKASANAGTHTGSLWAADGTRLATATFVKETASGWQEVWFDNPVPVSAGQTYVASYLAPKGRWSVTNNYFTPSGLASGHLRVLPATAGGGGAYAPGGGFPTQTNQSSNYWVDVSYTPDLTAPTVTTVTPQDGATNAPAASKVSVTFSKALDPATLTATSVQLLTAAGTAVSATAAYDPATRTVTLTPSAALAAGASYTVVVLGGSGPDAVRSLGGVPLAADFTSSFSTVAAPPAASAGADKAANEGAAVSFTGTAGGGTGTLSYHWDFGDGATADGTLTPAHTYADNGRYTVTLTVTDANNVTAVDTALVTVSNVAPTAALSNGGPVNLGVPVTISFSNQTDPSAPDVSAGFTYSYDFDNNGAWDVAGVATSSAATTFATTGTKTVKARIADKDGGFTDYTTTVQVTSQSPAPSAPTNLSAAAVSPSEVNLTWDLGDAADTAVVIERKTGAPGTYRTLAVLPGGENIFTDTSGWAGTTYYYRVKARNSGGDSAYAPEQAATTQAVPAGALAVVSNLAAVATSPTTAMVSFADTNTTNSYRMYFLERSADGISYQVVKSLGTSTSFADTGLTPGVTYSYRVRGASWTAATSDYSRPASVTLPTPALGTPVAPSGLQATDLSATSVALSWTNNDPTNPQFKVERAVYSTWSTMTWTQVAVTTAGATSFTDTGLAAERAYAYRVRATNAQGDSAYAVPASDVMKSLFGTGVAAVTASAGTGSARTYDIGPGQTYLNIADLDWSRLGPGDTVNIHYKPGGYHELFQIAGRGTPAAWITVNGVPDPATGALPVIDGANAILAPQFQNHYAPLSGYGAVVVGTRPGYVDGYKPGYLRIQNLQVQNAYKDYTFTDFDGTVKNYDNCGGGLYLERADHVTIQGCVIANNGEGVFGAGQSTFDRLMTDITLDSNSIYGNGNLNRYLEHNTYLEAIDTVYQFNRYGPTRSGSLGAGLKDRSVGTVIRYNYIEGGSTQLQLPEAQNQSDLALTLPRYHQMWVYGNTLVTPPGNGSSPIWFGGDQGLEALNRKGVLYLYNNSLIVRSSQAQVWKINAVKLSSAGEALDARNNILTALPSTPGATPPVFGLLAPNNNAYFGRNWVPLGYQLTSDPAGFVGHAAGTANLLAGLSGDPGFVNPAAGDYHLAASSAAIDASARLAGYAGAFGLSWEYTDPHTGRQRSVVGTAVDLGAFEFGN